MSTIDIVCPVFREEEGIATFHAALLDATDSLARSEQFRFIYVVDPSPDRTEAVLADLASRDGRIHVIVMSRRFGHQAALVAGLDASNGDAVVMLDSDMQHPPQLIPTLIEHWRSGADIVQTLRHDGDNITLVKRTTSALFYWFFERVAKIPLNPGAADYRLLSRRVADVFRGHLREHNPFLRGLVSWVGYKIVYVPFTPDKRAAGRSKYTLRSLGGFALNGLCSFSKLPLRICIFCGVAFALMSLLSGIGFTLYYFLAHEPRVPGWASLFALLSFGVSVNLFFLGVLGEYVGLIFDEVKDRPRYLVSRTYGKQPVVDGVTDSARLASG
jgi:glycosyltransferase involved in cell wall biosynthesis